MSLHYRTTDWALFHLDSLKVFPLQELPTPPAILILPRKIRRHVCVSCRRPVAMAVRLRLSRNRLAVWRFVILFCLVLPAVLYLFLAYIVPVSPALIPASLLLAKRPVLVVAHPDDESLFFGPTLLALSKAGEKKELRILVLSSGTSITWI